jgi:hypothetical protein
MGVKWAATKRTITGKKGSLAIKAIRIPHKPALQKRSKFCTWPPGGRFQNRLPHESMANRSAKTGMPIFRAAGGFVRFVPPPDVSPPFARI